MNFPQKAPPASASDKAIAFTRQSQILEILKESERLKIMILIRFSLMGTAVRGIIESFDPSANSLVIGGLSQEGFKLLKEYYDIKVEFVLLSKKLVFVSKIRGRVPGKILVDLPSKIVSLERRNNSRFRIESPNFMFLEIPEFIPDNSKFDSPFLPQLFFSRTPSPGSMVNQAVRVKVDDISLGGLALLTHFSLVADFFKLESTLDHVWLIPQGKPKVPLTVNVRWVKKSTSHLPEDQEQKIRQLLFPKIPLEHRESFPQMKETTHRIGLQFTEVPKELDIAVRSFVRTIQTSSAI